MRPRVVGCQYGVLPLPRSKHDTRARRCMGSEGTVKRYARNTSGLKRRDETADHGAGADARSGAAQGHEGREQTDLDAETTQVCKAVQHL